MGYYCAGVPVMPVMNAWLIAAGDRGCLFSSHRLQPTTGQQPTLPWVAVVAHAAQPGCWEGCRLFCSRASLPVIRQDPPLSSASLAALACQSIGRRIPVVGIHVWVTQVSGHWVCWHVRSPHSDSVLPTLAHYTPHTDLPKSHLLLCRVALLARRPLFTY